MTSEARGFLRSLWMGRHGTLGVVLHREELGGNEKVVELWSLDQRKVLRLNREILQQRLVEMSDSERDSALEKAMGQEPWIREFVQRCQGDFDRRLRQKEKARGDRLELDQARATLAESAHRRVSDRSSRIFEPPREALTRLQPPLSGTESQLLELFDSRLSLDWEIYARPHLNGLRPSLVLLHPGAGIAAFEVAEFDPQAKGSSIANAFAKIRLLKNELLNLYCPRLDARLGAAAISCGLVLTSVGREEAESLLSPLRASDRGMAEYPKYYPFAGQDDLEAKNLDVIFPEWKRETSGVMTENVAQDLRAWLREPFYSSEQRRPLELDARQRELVTSRTETGFRRMKGPAGSGKSVVLAARASELAAQGKHVLVATFNITLLNYLRDLAKRHVPGQAVPRRQIDFLHFHEWCKRVCFLAGAQNRYEDLWRGLEGDDAAARAPILEEGLAALVRELYADAENAPGLPYYDAILVDEGQDYRPSWWATLRMALRPGGEMVLAADKTQDIYSTASAWTEEAMSKAGFRGPWAELKVSYRLPPAVIAMASRFAEEFLAGSEIDLPLAENRPSQLDIADLFPAKLKWVQLRTADYGWSACAEEIRRHMEMLTYDTAVPDIVFLSNSKEGMAVVSELESRGVHVAHTFAEDKRAARGQKLSFFQSNARVKATTLQSFKGWEARQLVVFIERASSRASRAGLYTALTRLLRHKNGSALTVVSACESLRDFGRSWPEYLEIEEVSQVAEQSFDPYGPF